MLIQANNLLTNLVSPAATPVCLTQEGVHNISPLPNKELVRELELWILPFETFNLLPRRVNLT
jgi:hypothetical protein